MNTAAVSKPSRGFRPMVRVTVNSPIPIGGRPVVRPQGVIVEQNMAGLYRVQFADGRKYWFTEQELSAC